MHIFLFLGHRNPPPNYQYCPSYGLRSKSRTLHCTKERRVIGISGSLIWSRTLMKLIFNPCGEFRWCPEGPVSQIHSPHLHDGASGIFPDLLRSVQMLKKESGVREAKGKLLHLFIPGKTTALVPEFAVEDLPSEELRPRFLHLQWRTCPWAEHSDK